PICRATSNSATPSACARRAMHGSSSSRRPTWPRLLHAVAATDASRAFDPAAPVAWSPFMTMSNLDREISPDAADPLGLEGIEFIEYTTRRPQALGQMRETMGFKPIARHRSREVLLYRQGDMNIVVN